MTFIGGKNDGHCQICIEKTEGLTFTGGVQQRRLEAGEVALDRVLDGQLHAEACLRVDVGQRQQVSRPHEEVPVERVDTQA